MEKLVHNWGNSLTRRNAVRGLTGFLAGSSLLRAQQDVFRDHSRSPGLEELTSAFDFEPIAHAKLPREVFNYTAYGSAGEFTLRRNRAAFDRVELVPRGVANVTKVDTSTEVCGTKMAFPIMVAPTAAHVALFPEGEAATHLGCTNASNTPMIISANASLPVAKIAEAASGPLWWQLYPRQQPESNRPLLETAQQAGCQAIVITVDQQAAYYERRLHDRHLLNIVNRGGRGGRGGGRRPGAAGENPYRISRNRAWYDWKLFHDLRPMIQVPMLAKGILTAEDARLCVENGVEGILVSNHGGRALDHSPATMEVLQEIVDAVGGRIPVIVDSGFRRGSDVLKALALGASAVCFGRAPRYGLASFGADGVQKVLEILQGELVLAMAQTGRPNLASIDSSLVRTDFA
jgi:isopentenyl diphosphate isomerase/L-lactate dehydrogenase-like FMN-dependent dehydrogenase